MEDVILPDDLDFERGGVSTIFFEDSERFSFSTFLIMKVEISQLSGSRRRRVALNLVNFFTKTLTLGVDTITLKGNTAQLNKSNAA